MSSSIAQNPLYYMINPRSVAFFGASNNFINMGTMILNSVLNMGYEGQIYPIHPKESAVLGLTAYTAIDQTPQAPDLAILVLPTKVVGDVLEQCGRRGVKNAVVVSGGFQESGPEGAAMQERLKRIAEQYGMRFLGPNCLGVANPHCKINTTPLPYECGPGFIGLASQSGSFVTQMYDQLRRLSLGFSTALSVGNEANVDLVDCLEYLGDDPHTKVIGMYVETIRRGRRFVEVARRVALKKPIVAFYVGGSETGRRAALSHTGALAGPDKLYDGILRQAGVIRADTITELFDFCWALGSLPLPAGPNAVIQTDSGGPGAAAADACERGGLKLPPLGQSTIELLRPLVPHTGSLGNPVDITFPREFRNYYWDIPDALLRDENIHALLIYFVLPVELIYPSIAAQGLPVSEAKRQAVELVSGLLDQTRALIDAHGKPVVGYSFNSLEQEPLRGLIARGMPVFPSPQRAARAVAAMSQYARLRQKLIAQGQTA